MAQKPSGGKSGPSTSGKEERKTPNAASRVPTELPCTERAARTAADEACVPEVEAHNCHSGTEAGEGATGSLSPSSQNGGTGAKTGTETNERKGPHNCCKEKDAHPLGENRSDKQKNVGLEQDDGSLPLTATNPDATSFPNSDGKCRTSPVGSGCTAQGQQSRRDQREVQIHAACKLLPESRRGSGASPRRTQGSLLTGDFRPITLSQLREALFLASEGRPAPAFCPTHHQAAILNPDTENLAINIPFHLVCLPREQSHKVTRSVEADCNRGGFLSCPLVSQQDKSTTMFLSNVVTSSTNEYGTAEEAKTGVPHADQHAQTKAAKKIAGNGSLMAKFARWIEAGTSREEDVENALLLTAVYPDKGRTTEVAVQLEEEGGQLGSPRSGRAVSQATETSPNVKDAREATPMTLARKVKIADAVATCAKLSLTKVKALSSGWRAERVSEIISQPNFSRDPHSTRNAFTPFSSTASESLVGAGRFREWGSDSGSNGVAAIHLHVHDHLCAFSTGNTCKVKLSGSRPSEARGAEELTKSESSLLCRICQMGETESGEPVKRADCLCKGDLELIHRSCLVEWVRYKGNNTCELCRAQFSDVDPPVRRTSDLNRQQIMRNLLRHYSRLRPLSAKKRIMVALFLLFLAIMTTVMGILTKDADDNFRSKTSKRSLATEAEQHQAYVRFAVCWSFLLFCATLASATLSFWLCVEVAYFYHRRQVWRLALQLTEQTPATNRPFSIRGFL